MSAARQRPHRPIHDLRHPTPHFSHDVLLVGAGPIGLEVAAALKAHGVDYLHIEAGNIASTIAWYAPGTQIFSSPDRLAVAGVAFPLYPGIRALREDYLNYLRGVVQQHALAIQRFTRLMAVAARDGDGGFTCTLARSDGGVGGPDEESRAIAAKSGASHPTRNVLARRIVLAIGNMHLPRKLGIAGEDSPWASHYFGDPHEYAGARVAIVGGRNSAAEAAVRLARLGCAVALCHRNAELDAKRIKPWILPDLLTLAREGKVTIHAGTTPVAIEPRRLVLSREGNAFAVEVDRVLLLTGYTQSTALFKMLGLDLDPGTNAPVHDLATMQTSVPGVFVAGTAASGTQTMGSTHFIENCHGHAGRILAGLGVVAMGNHAVASDRPVEFREA